MNTWAQWLEQATDGDSLRRIASQIGFSKSSLSRWNVTGRPPADAVIAVAKAYDADLCTGLASAGYIRASGVSAKEILREIPTDLLVEEFHRRWRAGEIRGLAGPTAVESTN